MEQLTEEQYKQFIDELWDLGIPPVSLDEWFVFYEKWKNIVEMPTPNEKLLLIFRSNKNH